MKRLYLLALTLLVVLFSLVVPIIPAQAAPVLQERPGRATVLRSANLRAGPGTSYDIVGGAQPGQTLTIVECNAACDWYQLDTGAWIAAFLVTSADAAAPAVTAQPPSQPAGGTVRVTVNSAANLRAGPSTDYAILGRAEPGKNIDLKGRNEAGDWFQLTTDQWIFGNLISARPQSLPVVLAEDPPSTPTGDPPATPFPTPTPTAGTPNVVIQYVNYDGAVYRVESDEYAVIANNGSASQNMAGWVLNAGDGGQDFYFPNFELGPGQACRIYTNEVHPDTCGFSFRRGQAIWNNKGDCGVLYNASRQEVDLYCY